MHGPLPPPVHGDDLISLDAKICGQHIGQIEVVFNNQKLWFRLGHGMLLRKEVLFG